MANLTDKAAEVLGEPLLAVVWRKTEFIAKEIQNLRPEIEACNEKSYLKGALDLLEDAHKMVMDVSIRCAVIIETGYRMLPPEQRNAY